ncbi:MAG: ribonuclease H [bacterium]|nr:ribonuclease H [bacterium]
MTVYKNQIVLYTDGACSGNPGPGGYAAIVVAYDADGSPVKEKIVTGGAKHTTNNQMEIRAVIDGLRALETPTAVTIVSDSQYVIYTMTKNWKRNKNQDLWEQLDDLVSLHKVKWTYVKGHAGHAYNERCDQLAVAEIAKFRQ